MSQHPTHTVDPTRHDLMVRLNALEQALQVLEWQVRDVDRQPRHPFERSIEMTGRVRRQPEERRLPALVVEVAA